MLFVKFIKGHIGIEWTQFSIPDKF